jgi:hypothetical protein
LTLASTVSFDEGYADLEMHLVNRSGRAIPSHFKKGDAAILICDARGTPVLPNESAKEFCVGWRFWGADEWGVLLPDKESTGYKSGGTGSYRLSGQYALHAGRDYTLLSAVRLRETDALVVAAPITFHMHNPYRASDRMQGPRNPEPSPAVPRRRPEDWSQYERFAGKTFEGLVLRAHLGDSLKLDVALENSSRKSILIRKWKGVSDYHLLLRDGLGKSVPMTAKGRQFFQHSTLLDIHDLKPGEQIVAALPLAELFEIENPGDYTVLASLPVIGDVDAVLTAAPVRVRVEPKTPTPKK